MTVELRRNIIGGIATALLAPPSLEPAQRTDWSFLKTPKPPKVTTPYVIDNYVPLSSEVQIIGHDFKTIMKAVEPVLMQEVRRNNFDNQGYSANATLQFYGMSEEPRLTRPLAEYCREAVDIVHEHLPELARHEVNWTAIKPGENYAANPNGRGFLGRSVYSVQRVSARGTTNKSQTINLAKHSSLTGGITYAEYGPSGSTKLKWWLIFIGTGPDALFSPFFEYIHLGVAQRTREYMVGRKFDAIEQEKINAIDEALAHGIGYFLGQRLARANKLGNEYEKIFNSITMTDPDYRYVLQSAEWVRKNGARTALKLYMEDPMKYGNAIKAQ